MKKGHKPYGLYEKCVKRPADCFLAICAIIILSPVLLVTAVLVRAKLGAPVLFTQDRPGKDEKIFKLYKFRSMTNEKDENGMLLPEEKRITKFGLFLRKTSLDELPELINIIKGDMAIIGPRALLIEYLPLYSERYAMRHSVRPGLACVRIMPSESKTWTWREQFENDIFYIEHISLCIDVQMFFAIIKEVFRASDYRANDTRVPFDGTNLDETRSKNEVENVKRYDSVSK